MRAVALALLAALAVADAAGAQTPEAAEGAGTAREVSGRPSQEAPPDVDAAKLGVSMSRIQRGLRISEAREARAGDGLKLEFQVQVFGQAPRIDIIQDFDIGRRAPLQYGAPTHAEFLNQWTPQAFRSPRVPISSMAGWALFQLVQRSDKSKCEQELADYRALVMQGISVAPPRCTQ
jgi:hypothetical protein